MTGDPAGEVLRLEPWQLPSYLTTLARGGVDEVTWNREAIPLATASERAAGLTPTSTVVVDGATIYVAEPDHSADDAPRQSVVPIQVFPRRREP